MCGKPSSDPTLCALPSSDSLYRLGMTLDFHTPVVNAVGLQAGFSTPAGAVAACNHLTEDA